jgi:hypothetical protein
MIIKANNDVLCATHESCLDAFKKFIRKNNWTHDDVRIKKSKDGTIRIQAKKDVRVSVKITDIIEEIK